MDIYIRNQQTDQEISTDSLKQILKQALQYLVCEDRELSVLLVDDIQIHELNLKYRHKDFPTDVLAFCQQDEDDPSVYSYLLGDIVISVATAQRQAQEMNHSLEQELKILLIHGLLHLLGYDHIQDDEAAVMQEKEKELLAHTKLHSKT